MWFLLPFSSSFFSLPNFSRRRLDACHTSTHGVALVRISDHIDYTISRYQSRICQAYDVVAAIYRTISCTNACLACALLAYQRRRLRLIDVVARHAHRPWLPVPHIPCGRPVMQHISDMHSKFALRPHHVWKYGRHPIYDG